MSSVITESERLALLLEARRHVKACLDAAAAIVAEIKADGFEDQDIPGSHHGHARRYLPASNVVSFVKRSRRTFSGSAVVIPFPAGRSRRV